MPKALAPLIAAVFLAVAAPPAGADGPAGGCSTPYTLTAISSLPPVAQPVAIATDQKGNNDGYVCVKPFENANHPGGPFQGIDNRVQAQ